MTMLDWFIVGAFIVATPLFIWFKIYHHKGNKDGEHVAH